MPRPNLLIMQSIRQILFRLFFLTYELITFISFLIVQLDKSSRHTRETSWRQSQFWWSRPPHVTRCPWRMWRTSRSRRSCTWRSTDPTRRADIDRQACQRIRVSTRRTFTCTVARSTNGADADTHRSAHSAMASANGSLPDAVQWTSTCRRVDTTSCVIASSVPMRHSATVLTSMYSSGLQNIIEASGVWPTLSPGGPAWATGCSLSTSEHGAQRGDRFRATHYGLGYS